jgi:hypothetical protein
VQKALRGLICAYHRFEGQLNYIPRASTKMRDSDSFRLIYYKPLIAIAQETVELPKYLLLQTLNFLIQERLDLNMHTIFLLETLTTAIYTISNK